MGLGGTGGGGQPGQIQGSDISNAMFGTQASNTAMINRYKELGLSGTGATPSGPTTGAVPGVPGSGTTPTSTGPFIPGGGAGGGGGATGSWTPSTPLQMDIGQLPSWTGGIPNMFQAVLGEGQFQDLAETTQAAVGAQQAKGQAAAGIGQLIGGI